MLLKAIRTLPVVVTLLGAAPFVSAVSSGMPLKIIAGFHGNPLKDSYADISASPPPKRAKSLRSSP